MRASLLLLSLLLFSFSFVSAQDRCTLRVSPEVRGFKLGQTYNSLVDRFPTAIPISAVPLDSEVDLSDIGVRSIDLSGASLNFDQKGQFDSVNSVHLTFLKDWVGEFPQHRIVSIEIYYDPSVRWKDNLEFTSVVADRLKLPREGWRGRNPTVLSCDGFNVETSYNASARIRVADNNLPAELIRRRKEVEKKKRESFKP